MIACFSLSWSFITKKQASLYQVTFGKNGVETVHPIGDLNEYDTRLKACVTQALAKSPFKMSFLSTKSFPTSMIFDDYGRRGQKR